MSYLFLSYTSYISLDQRRLALSPFLRSLGHLDAIVDHPSQDPKILRVGGGKVSHHIDAHIAEALQFKSEPEETIIRY
jgi:hypothetical protein